LRRHKYSSTEIRNRVHHLEEQKRLKKSEENIIEQYSPEILEKYSIKNNQS
jgi:hypothetical protein